MKLQMYIIVIKDIVLDFLFPKQCIKCGKYGGYICKHCKKMEIQFVERQFCHVCHFPFVESTNTHQSCSSSTDLEHVFVCVRYSRLVEKILQEVKYYFHFDYVKLICDLMLEVLEIEFLKDAILVPIPLFGSKFRKRGFNQAELIAIEIYKRVGDQANCRVHNLLKRIKNTKTQVGMSREERLVNLKDVFSLVTDFRTRLMPKNQKIILVDDVMTTGTTLEECAKVLKSNGFKNIHALVFARG